MVAGAALDHVEEDALARHPVVGGDQVGDLGVGTDGIAHPPAEPATELVGVAAPGGVGIEVGHLIGHGL